MPGSETVAISSTPRRMWSKVDWLSEARRPSAMVLTSVSGISRPAANERAASSAPAGSAPTTRAAGRSAFTAVETPLISPPPPIGASTRSRSGASSISSSAAVPWPAITAGSSNGWIIAAPVSATIRAAVSSRAARVGAQ